MADESEENSLSISLPSEGSQKLSEVKAGILRIFDEAEVTNDKNIQPFDNVIFDEKHEFEKTEKMKAKESTPASTAASELDFDSGYDRCVESRSSSKVWNKIHKQLNRRFGGSTGSLSSTSPNSETAIKQPEPFVKTADQLESK